MCCLILEIRGNLIQMITARKKCHDKLRHLCIDVYTRSGKVYENHAMELDNITRKSILSEE